jgi:hypothetical protein
MGDEEQLFFWPSLGTWLENKRRAARQAIQDWDTEQLLATAAPEVADQLMDQYSVSCPVLHRSRITQHPVTETGDNGMETPVWNGLLPGVPSPAKLRRTKAMIEVRYDGDGDIFALRPSKYRPDPPCGLVLYPDTLVLTWTSDGPGSGDPVAVRRHFDDQLDKIEQYLSWARVDIDRHNAALRTVITTHLAQRRAKLLADRELEVGLGFPVWPPRDPARPVAEQPMTAVPGRPAADGTFRQHPVPQEELYEQALAVLRSARNALERTPAITARLNEEKIRDLLLAFLNTKFEGAAVGEAFNAAGKTDILIRAGDRNVLIAECKIWSGPKTMQDGITQLLRYLTWRDTRAALLVFIRRGQPTDVISKAVLEITRHPNFTRMLGAIEADDRYDFALHANGDPDQEIQLAFMPFALQDNTEAE